VVRVPLPPLPQGSPAEVVLVPVPAPVLLKVKAMHAAAITTCCCGGGGGGEEEQQQERSSASSPCHYSLR